MRIVIVGSGGAGKSTLAIRLGECLRLPVVHLDQVFWQPGWKRMTFEEQDLLLGPLLAGDRWIIDGDHIRTQKRRMAQADTVIFMDYPRWRCLCRVVGRAIRHRKRARPGMNEGCHERINWALLRWVWRYKNLERPQLIANIAELDGKNVIVLKSDREVAGFVQGLVASLPHA